MTFSSYLDDSKVMASVPTPAALTAADRPLRALVRGTGSIGARHLRVLHRLGVQELFAWPVRPATPGAARNADYPDSVQLVRGYPEEPLDLVIIATDTNRHVADTIEALERSPASILLEKPVAPSAEEARVLRDHPRANTITVSAPLRFHQGLALAAEVLPRLGRVTSAQVLSQSWLPDWRPGRDFRSSYSARKDDGGVLRDLVHDIDYPALLLGAPASVKATLGEGILGIEAEESADMLWGDGPCVHLRLDYVTPVKTRSIRITTDQGALVWDVVRNEVTLDWAASADQGPAGPVSAVFPEDADVDVVLARQSLAVLERAGTVQGRSMELFSPAGLGEGLLAVAICDAARLASAAGGTEKVLW